ncbi:flagellar protein FlaG [Paenibacillus sp. GSMTC-2017]|nr:flagellar protein FlaG [Paenibacillus sp. GSMTC-2017]
MDLSVTGRGGSTDRVASANKSVEPVKNAVNNAVNNAAESSVYTVNNLNDLRSAELRGDQFTVSEEQLVKAIDRAIKAMQGTQTSLEFTIHEQTKMIAVKVLNRESGEVIREIPPEKTLDFVAKLWEMAGILIDEKR